MKTAILIVGLMLGQLSYAQKPVDTLNVTRLVLSDTSFLKIAYSEIGVGDFVSTRVTSTKGNIVKVDVKFKHVVDQGKLCTFELRVQVLNDQKIHIGSMGDKNGTCF